jgi:urease accessory protein
MRSSKPEESLPFHGHDHSHSPESTEPGSAGPQFCRQWPGLRVGVAGPIGSGKTTLIIELAHWLTAQGVLTAVVTNDVYTTVDADIVTAGGALSAERVVGIATGGCPHTAIRDDISVNEAAASRLEGTFPNLDVLFIESGGDNLTTTFSYELVDRWICVIDVAGGDKVPSKGGPGITRSDFLLVNKAELAPYVGASLERMERDASAQREERPLLLGSCRNPDSIKAVGQQIEKWLAEVRAEGA